MAVIKFKKNAARADLYALAVENGVAVEEDAARPAIIAALEAHNAQEAAADGGEGNYTTPGADGAQDGAEAAGEASGDTAPASPVGTTDEEAPDGSEERGTGGGGTEGRAEDTSAGAEDRDGGSGTTDTTPGGGAAEGRTEATSAGAEGHDSGSGTTDTAPGGGAAEGRTEAADTFVYVGPSIPRGRLRANAIFRGNREDVLAYLADVVKDYPQVKNLIVPINRLAFYSARVKTPGNIAHKHYNDIISAMSRKREV